MITSEIMSSMLGVMVVVVVVGRLMKENEEYHKVHLDSELQEMRYTRTWKKISKDVSKTACS